MPSCEALTSSKVFCIDRYSLLRRLFLCCLSSRVASTIHVCVRIFLNHWRLSYIAYILTCSHVNARVLLVLFSSSATVVASNIRYNIPCHLWLESRNNTRHRTYTARRGYSPTVKMPLTCIEMSSSVSLLTYVTWLWRDPLDIMSHIGCNFVHWKLVVTREGI